MITNTRPYHHGALPSALLDAAQAELAEKGIEAFSLRGVAKRAGVSHAAPAHHFGDVQGLLTALAARGFERFVQRQQAFRRRAAPDARAQLLASGLGYVVFAEENPAIFRLMFGSNRPNFEDDALRRAAGAAYDDFVAHVARARESHPPSAADPDLMEAVAATWAVAHGLADLLVAGRLSSIAELAPKARREAVLSVLARVV